MVIHQKKLFSIFSIFILIFLTNWITVTTSEDDCIRYYRFDENNVKNSAIPLVLTDSVSGGNEYSIYRDGTLVKRDTWENMTMVNLPIKELSAGTYNLTIVITDNVGLVSRCSHLITVNRVYSTTTEPAASPFLETSIFTLFLCSFAIEKKLKRKYT
jgi:hypothetical protein